MSSSDSKETFKQASLQYHRLPKPGKLEISPTTPLDTQSDLAKAYSPGVAYACGAIVSNPAAAAEVTARGNLVGVISNGTAVLGLGSIGALASKPVMEGKAVLFKKFANIDVFDIEVDQTDVDKFVDIVCALEPTFGGINLEDIKAPECFEIERMCRERMNIPVFHDDQHGTAIVAAAAVYNGLKIVNKRIEEVVLVASGAGAASIACINLMVSMGLKKENVYVCDSKGLIYRGRTEGMNRYKEAYAQETDKRTLAECMDGADIFLGLSGPGSLSAEMLVGMKENPLILAMANPVPEITPEKAKATRPDCIIATGRSDYPNQVNNVLCFPFIFRGALDCGASTINEEMKVACVKAIAELALQESTDEVAQAYAGEQLKFGPEYIIPKPFDSRLIAVVPPAVVKAAMESGVATRPIEDLNAYQQQLNAYVVRSSMFMQPVVAMAQSAQSRLAYAEGENEMVLHAVQKVVDERVATPVLIGRTQVIEEKIADLGLRLKVGENIEVINPETSELTQSLAEEFHAVVGRRGNSVEASQTMVRTHATVLAAMLVRQGIVDGMICGKIGRFDYHLRRVTEILGMSSKQPHLTSLSTLLLKDGPLFLADCFINIDPTVEQIVSTTESAIEQVHRFGITPKVALLSHSNFGSSTAPSAQKMRKASELLRRQYPDLEIDGEMHAVTALDEEYRNTIFEHSHLKGSANLLIFPNIDAAHLALGLLRRKANGLLVGPFLSGLAKPAHILVNSASARSIYNTSALAAADILRYQQQLAR
ncbi:NADP-dependent malic enzyme [Halioxenophilus sp. WMMB6]|uniref:NADP-dependent malic enzyme n=1 Tax=Halioxenophilus sp. WMMB6 TaxID=3073815 RepID=UPI00295ED892|nr:NADP-dependent malic enzyme [Halioxenophilus sp. WMMB6]